MILDLRFGESNERSHPSVQLRAPGLAFTLILHTNEHWCLEFLPIESDTERVELSAAR
jgi:hypothetical protein